MTEKFINTKKQFLAFLKIGKMDGLGVGHLGIFAQAAVGLFRDDRAFHEECNTMLHGIKAIEEFKQAQQSSKPTYVDAGIASDKHVYDDKGNCLTCYEPTVKKAGQKDIPIYSRGDQTNQKEQEKEVDERSMFDLVEEAQDYEDIMTLLVKRHGAADPQAISMEIQILHEHYCGDLPGKPHEQEQHEYDQENIERFLDHIATTRERLLESEEMYVEKMKEFDDAKKMREEREVRANNS